MHPEASSKSMLTKKSLVARVAGKSDWIGDDFEYCFSETKLNIRKTCILAEYMKEPEKQRPYSSWKQDVKKMTDSHPTSRIAWLYRHLSWDPPYLGEIPLQVHHARQSAQMDRRRKTLPLLVAIVSLANCFFEIKTKLFYAESWLREFVVFKVVTGLFFDQNKNIIIKILTQNDWFWRKMTKTGQL